MKKIYYNECLDSFAAAWVAWRNFGKGGEYHETSADSIFAPHIYGSDSVYLFGLDLPEEELADLATQCEMLVSINRREVRLYKGEVFAESHWKSVGRAAWEFFHPNDYLPWMIQYVEDNVLQRNKLSYSKEIYAGIRHTPKAFTAWNEVHLVNPIAGKFHEFGARQLKREKEAQTLEVEHIIEADVQVEVTAEEVQVEQEGS